MPAVKMTTTLDTLHITTVCSLHSPHTVAPANDGMYTVKIKSRKIHKDLQAIIL